MGYSSRDANDGVIDGVVALWRGASRVRARGPGVARWAPGYRRRFSWRLRRLWGGLRSRSAGVAEVEGTRETSHPPKAYLRGGPTTPSARAIVRHNGRMPESAREHLRRLARGEQSAVELVSVLIERAHAHSELGAFELLDEVGALKQAARADRLRARGGEPRSGLLGLPVVVKDNIDVGGLPTRGGTLAWGRDPGRDAPAVARLRAAGAVILGKGHLNELAFGIDGVNPHRPPCRHPQDSDRLPGGSTSGPTAAVAASLAPAGLGTDTSGSLRVPAALCGVAALRPTPGRISTAGVLPLAPSYDTVGPVAAGPEDLELLFAALAADGPSVPAPIEPRAPEAPRRVGVVADLLDPGVCHPAAAAATADVALRLTALGLEPEPLSLPFLADALEVHAGIQLPEAAASVDALEVPIHQLGPTVRARCQSGAELAPEAHRRALARRSAIRAAFEAVFAEFDLLLAPAAPCFAPPREATVVDLGEGRSRALREALLSCVVPFAQASLPVLALPAGKATGLPLGVQLVGPPAADETLLAVGRWLADI
jgi:Asp-tRNA(Asn)/Glu-tRNA(Gln) amidotransferase A subunit family amidase